MKNVYFMALIGFVAGTLLARVAPVNATLPFKKEFDHKYVKEEPTTDAEKNLAAAVAKVKCNVCHEGKSKKNRNAYGKAINNFITKKDIKDTEKIKDALDKVAALKSNADDAQAPTFGELIEQGKLPGGEPDETASAE